MTIHHGSWQTAGLAQVYHSLSETNAARMGRYKRLAQAYDMVVSVTAAGPEHPDDFQKRRNFMRKFISVHAEFGFSSGFSVTIPDDPDTTEVETDSLNKIAIYLNRVWQQNGGDGFMMTAGQMGSLFGDVFIRVSWDSEPDLLYNDKPMVRLTLLPPMAVLPVFSPRTGGMDAVMIALEPEPTAADKDPSKMQVGGATATARAGLQHDLEYWTKDKVITYRNGIETTRANPLGFIPVIHIPNYPAAGSRFGESDVIMMLDSQSEFQAAAAIGTKMLRFHVEPTTVILGASAQNMEKGADKLWSINAPDAKIVNLEIKDSMESLLAYMERCKTDMHELSNLPDGILGSIDTGDSAAATLLKFQPLLTRWKVKQRFYNQGMVAINRAILRIAQVKDKDMATWFLELPVETRYTTEIAWENPMPREESLELDKSAKRLQLGLSTREAELIRHHGFSPADARAMVNASREEREQDAYLEMQAASGFGLDPRLREIKPEEEDTQQNRSGNPNPSRPNPEVQGTRRSMTVMQNASRGSAAPTR